MKIENKRIEELVKRFLLKETTPEEEQELFAWYNQGQDMPVEIPEAFAATENELQNRILDKVNTEIGVRRTFKLWPRIAVAAAVAAVVFGVWFYNARYNTSRHAELISASPLANDIAPGGNRATLTAANGKAINLSEKQTGIAIDATSLAYNDGTKIDPSKLGMTNEATGTLLTLTTPRGGMYQSTLPDGTKVWLNADSKLEFSSDFGNKVQRIVKLEGEAYFEVAKDKKHPFVVQTATQEVEVLGTHFNINSYTNEGVIATTLIEGSVRVSQGKRQQILEPGYQALNTGKAIEVSKADIDNITDWKEGDFNLDRVDFRTAMRKIERWYGVQVVYDATVPNDIETGGWISRNKPLSQVLKFIELSGLVHFKIEGRMVYVSK